MQRLSGHEVTVDGTSGEIFDGVLDLVAVAEDTMPELARIAAWARSRAPKVDGPLPVVLATVQASATFDTPSAPAGQPAGAAS